MNKTLIIITDSDDESGESFWNIDKDTKREYLEIDPTRRAIIIKRDDDEYTESRPDIVALLNENPTDEVGILIHFAQGNTQASGLRDSLPDEVQVRLKFCDWHSTKLIGFWDDPPHENKTLPYNAFREAVLSGVEKAEAFERVWNFFVYDPVTEAKLGLLDCILNERAPDPKSGMVMLLKDGVAGFDEHFGIFVRALKPSTVEGQEGASNFYERFEEFKRLSPDIFSTEYQTAYEKLRDALGVE